MDFCAVTSVNLLGYIVDFKNRFTHKSGHKSLLWFQFCIKLMLGCLQKNVRGLCIKLLTTVIFGPLRHDGLWLLTDYISLMDWILYYPYYLRKQKTPYLYILCINIYIEQLQERLHSKNFRATKDKWNMASSFKHFTL